MAMSGYEALTALVAGYYWRPERATAEYRRRNVQAAQALAERLPVG